MAQARLPINSPFIHLFICLSPMWIVKLDYIAIESYCDWSPFIRTLPLARRSHTFVKIGSNSTNSYALRCTAGSGACDVCMFYMPFVNEPVDTFATWTTQSDGPRQFTFRNETNGADTRRRSLTSSGITSDRCTVADWNTLNSIVK